MWICVHCVSETGLAALRAAIFRCNCGYINEQQGARQKTGSIRSRAPPRSYGASSPNHHTCGKPRNVIVARFVRHVKSAIHHAGNGIEQVVETRQ